MKRITVTILLVIYFTFSSGATISIHYCMGELYSWGFQEHNIGKCKRCGMEKKGKNGCCKDEYKKIQVGKDHKAAENNYDFNLIIQVESYSNIPDINFSFSFAQEGYLSIHPPPLLSSRDVILRNCVFRI